MAGGNTIGTGAVVLTANADSLLAGLGKAQRATDKFASGNRKAYDSLVSGGAKLAGYMEDVDYTKKMGPAKAAGGAAGGKGGLVGGLLFGAGIGAGISAVLGGLDAVGKGVEMLSQVRERAKAYSNIPPSMQAGIDRAGKGFDRISAALDEFLFRAAGRLAPLIEKVAGAIEAVGFVGAEALGSLADAAADVAVEIGKWLGVLDETGTATMTTQEVVMAFLRGMVEGFAYVWDTAKAGAGAVSYVAGVVVEGFGEVVKVVALAAKQLDALAKELPEAIRPEWVGKAAAAIDGFGDRVGKVGAGMQRWGKDAVTGFGDSVKAVDKWFDGVEKRFAATDRLMQKWEGSFLGGAFTRNSTEAYSVMAKFQGGNMIADGQKRMENIARGQLEELKEIKKRVEPPKAF